jgi:membrane protein YdbS with pleckstrin-like domain
MGKDVNEKVIKPPVERVVSGKIFKPSKAYLHKMLVQAAFVAAILWLVVVLGFICISSLVAYGNPVKYPDAAQFIHTWLPTVAFWAFVPHLVWLVPTLIFLPPYYRSIEYSVKAESGESMPEVYIKQGILTITRKHLPFRTVTNISSHAGPFDRMFGIGSVHIETAGFSGTSQTSPEGKLEGIVFYEEVRDFILNELRKYRAPYATGTEVTYPVEKPVPRTEGLDAEILITLREIRDMLRNKRFDKGLNGQ